MRRLLVPLFVELLLGCANAFSQTPSDPGRLLKKWTFYWFGVDASPTGQGFEFPVRLTDGPFTSYGLECPRCVIRPATDRTRFTLPPFGSQATLSFGQDRAELFSGFGGVNAWRADNVTIEPDRRYASFRRDSSFNDAWLAQGWAGARVAVDPSRHVWLGALGRYLSNFGDGKKHWNTFGGSATYQFGR